MNEKIIDGKSRLKIIRAESGRLSQAAFAREIGVAEHKIKSIEIGKTKISVDIALVVEEKFNYSFKWILTGIGEAKTGVKQGKRSTGNSHLHGVESEHCDIIKKFKNKQVAKEINEKLLDLEAIGEQTFLKAVNYIDVLWDAATVAIRDYKSTQEGQGGAASGRQKNGTIDP